MKRALLSIPLLLACRREEASIHSDPARTVSSGNADAVGTEMIEQSVAEDAVRKLSPRMNAVKPREHRGLLPFQGPSPWPNDCGADGWACVWTFYVVSDKSLPGFEEK